MIYKYASETKQWETITTTRKFEYAEYNECYTVLQSRKRYEIWYKVSCLQRNGNGRERNCRKPLINKKNVSIFENKWNKRVEDG